MRAILLSVSGMTMSLLMIVGKKVLRTIMKAKEILLFVYARLGRLTMSGCRFEQRHRVIKGPFIAVLKLVS